MIINGELSKKQLRELRGEMAKLELPKAKRQRLLWRMAKHGAIVAAKRNIRNQQQPDGRPFAGRQSKRRGKMLRNMTKLLHIRDMPEIEGVRIYLQGGGYRNGKGSVPAGVVGYAQSAGMSVTINRKQVVNKHDLKAEPPAREGEVKPPTATPRQAKRLRALGYRVRGGKGWRKPRLKEITQTMSLAHAGLLIRLLSNQPKKTTWSVTVPARPFLGLSDEEFNKALARQLQAIGFGWDVKAQDMKGKL